MTTLTIDKCNIVFSNTGFAALDQYLISNRQNISKIIILCDSNTLEHCLPILTSELPNLEEYEILEIEVGETHKNLDSCRSLWEALSEFKADRHTLMINLGGGVVCDMGGFVASCYMRGIRFINIPTTLLSQVDASVGGKTGVDLGTLKNIVGIFVLPEMVVVSSAFLPTLPQRELLSGFAEMIKHGLIASPEHWKKISSSADFSMEMMDELIWESVKIKYDVVTQDFKEIGLRKTLNFGHTIGHAIESYFIDSARPLSHGHSIAIGMVCECYLSALLQGFDMEFTKNFKGYINGMFGEVVIPNEDFESIIEFMSHDKKNSTNGINFSLLENIGHCTTDHYLDKELIRDSLNFYQK